MTDAVNQRLSKWHQHYFQCLAKQRYKSKSKQKQKSTLTEIQLYITKKGNNAEK